MQRKFNRWWETSSQEWLRLVPNPYKQEARTLCEKLLEDVSRLPPEQPLELPAWMRSRGYASELEVAALAAAAFGWGVAGWLSVRIRSADGHTLPEGLLSEILRNYNGAFGYRGELLQARSLHIEFKRCA